MENLNDAFLKSISELYTKDKKGLDDLLNKFGYYLNGNNTIHFNLVTDLFIYNKKFQYELIELIKVNNIKRANSENKKIEVKNRIQFNADNNNKFNQFINESKTNDNLNNIFIISLIIGFSYLFIKQKK